jgi:uncharacterized membrane protein
MSQLWVIGYDQVDRAGQVRDQLWKIEEARLLVIEDMVVAVRPPDGPLKLHHELHPILEAILRGSLMGFLVGLLVLRPLAGAAVGALLTAAILGLKRPGISRAVVREVGAATRPGTSTLFLLDRAKDLDDLLPRLRGFGGKVLKTNVDLHAAQRMQEALNAPAGVTAWRSNGVHGMLCPDGNRGRPQATPAPPSTPSTK